AETILALDCGRLMGTLVDGVKKLDLAMTPLLDLAAVALRRGERVGLLVFDSRPRIWLPPRPGMQQLQRMLVSLAKLPEQEEPTSYLRAIAQLEARQRTRSRAGTCSSSRPWPTRTSRVSPTTPRSRTRPRSSSAPRPPSSCSSAAAP